MAKTWVLALGIVVLAVIAIYAGLLAQGAPSAPVLVNNTTLNPGVAQTVSITVTSQLYSAQTPNSIFLLGNKLLYSAWQGTTLLAADQVIAMNAVASSGLLYTVQVAVPVFAAQLCQPAACGGVVDNITIRAQTQITVYGGLYVSPWENITFSNVQSYTTHQNTNPAVPMSNFAWNFGGSITLLFAVAFLVAWVMKPSPVILWVDVILWIVVAAEFVVFVLIQPF